MQSLLCEPIKLSNFRIPSLYVLTTSLNSVSSLSITVVYPLHDMMVYLSDRYTLFSKQLHVGYSLGISLLEQTLANRA